MSVLKPAELNKETPNTYLTSQKILHWIVVIGILFQFAINEPIVRATQAIYSGNIPETSDSFHAWVHVTIGTIILLSVIARIALRVRYGVPKHANGISESQAKIADAMHRLLYGLLLVMVITGMLTWNEIVPFGNAHFIISVLLFFMSLGHAGVTIYSHFIRKDETLKRMLPWV